ncbi:hypothetical protein MMC08_008417 [Hypocenomyce scalaris]|nr:hypothetical protein [Hypocenomyce scalaris]
MNAILKVVLRFSQASQSPDTIIRSKSSEMLATSQHTALLSEEDGNLTPPETSPGEFASPSLHQKLSKFEKLQKIYLYAAAVLITTALCLYLASSYRLITYVVASTNNISNPFTSSAAFAKPKPVFTDCGDNPSTARSRGCSFDVLSFSWQTPECYDEPLISSFLAYPPEPWRWYTNVSGTEEVSLAVAAQGERDLFVSWEYHIVHCTFMWMQMHRAYTVRRYIDSHLDSWKHTLHCQLVMLERGIGMDVVSVAGKVMYPECRAVGGETFGDGPKEEIGRLKMPKHSGLDAWRPVE